MRILHLSSEYPPQQVYGLGRYVRELAQAQTAAGHSVEVFTNSMGGEQKDINSDGLEVRRVHFPPPPKAPVTSAMIMHFNLQLVERCVEQRLNGNCREYGVIHAHDWLTVPAAFHIGRLFKTPVVVTLHDVIFNKVRHRNFSPEDEFIAGIENWACQFAAKILVMSDFVRKEIIQSYHAEPTKIGVVAGGVAIEPLEASELPAAISFRRRFAEDSENLMLYAGRLDAEKGLPTLLDAAKRLLENKGRWKLIIAGSGRLTKEIQQFIERSHLAENVFLVGYLPFDQLRLAYVTADFVIIPSTYEPFGLVSLEAQRMGTPVICADIGGLRETLSVTHGGVSFTASNSGQLYERLKQLLEDTELRQRLSSNARQNVPLHFNWQLLARQIDYAYRTIENKPPENVFTREYLRPSPPSEILRDKVLEERRPVDSINGIVVISPQDIADLKAALDCLGNLHAIQILKSNISVIVDQETKPPKNSANIQFLVRPDANTVAQKVNNSSFVLVFENYPDSYVKILENAPLVWWKKRPSHRKRGKIVEDLRQLYAVSNKLLCDQRMRKALNPSICNTIKQIQWKCPSRDKKLVLHILPQLVTGGAETTLLEIVKGTKESFAHSILCLGSISGPLPEEFAALNVPLFQSDSHVEIVRQLAAAAPDILHLHSMSYIPDWIPIHRQLAMHRLIETEHVVNIGSGHFGPVNRVVCVSNATRHAHEPYFKALADSKVKFELIYNGITEQDYTGLPSTIEARKRLQLPLDKKIIGRVSALARNKLPINGLKAFEVTASRLPDALFVVVGDGPERAAAEMWVREHGLADRIVFLGERRDIPEVLAAFDVFAYYTEKDALGNVLLEAAAAGIPIVATDIEGTREAIVAVGGRSVPLNDFDAFADAVDKALQKGKAEVKPLPLHFTSAFMCQEYLRIYNDLLSEVRGES